MTKFIDLIYCSGLNGGEYLACAPMIACIRKGDIVCIDGMNDFCVVSCKTCVAKDSDTYEFITEAFGDTYNGLHKVTDKYSHQEVEDSENE